MIAVACINVGEVIIAKDSFNAGDFGFGLLFGASGVGLAIGSFFGGMLAERRTVATLFGPAMILAGVGYVVASIAPNVWVAAIPFAVGGHRQRRRGALQRAADPARRAGLVPRPRVHARDERDLRGARSRDGPRRAADEPPRRAVDLGDRRLPLGDRRLRRPRDLAAAAGDRAGETEPELEGAEAASL